MGFVKGGGVKGTKGKGRVSTPLYGASKGSAKGKSAQSWGKGASSAWAPPSQSWGKGVQTWGKGRDKGNGKGKGRGKLTTSPFKKVWIGGFPEQEQIDRELNKALQEHCKQAGDCKNVMIGKNGQGCAAFATEEEAEGAIPTLNGTTFQSYILEVDAWTKSDGSAHEKTF